MIKINQPVPDFNAKAFHDGNFKDVSLSDYKGKWVVLFFYPADFTFVCPTELKELAEIYDQLKLLDAEILSVSRDSEFVHKVWHQNSPSVRAVRFPMIADTSGKICKTFGTYIDEGVEEGLSHRGTFLIDPEGTLKMMEIQDNDTGRNADELLRKIEAMKFVREHEGEACPASWKPGQQTIKPTISEIGKN